MAGIAGPRRLPAIRHPFLKGLHLNTAVCQRCEEPMGREAGRRHLRCQTRPIWKHGKVPTESDTCMACCKPKPNEPGRVHAACAARLAQRRRRLAAIGGKP